jgi:threonine aldolase
MMIDLRSDTLTLPSLAMRQAMFEAQLGDDGFGEDPSVNQLELLAAETTGKEAGLFFTSGTQANLVALQTHCQRGHEIILGDLSHIFLLEAGGSAAIGGIHSCPLRNQKDGSLKINDIEEAIRPEDKHFAHTHLICLENTHMMCSGTILSPEYTDQVGELAQHHHLAVHLDGARIFNAAVQLQVEVKVLTRAVDSVMFSLSKGLGSPIGALLCGTRAFITEARLWRQMLGGGMHQAGVAAAAGIEAMKNYIPQLQQDNENARYFAEVISRIPDFDLDLETVQSNIVMWKLVSERFSPQDLVARVETKGVRIMHLGGRLLRAVTHNGISAADIRQAAQIITETMA